MRLYHYYLFIIGIILLLSTLVGSAGDLNAPDFELPESMRQDWNRMHYSKQDALDQFNEDKLGMFIHWGLYSLTSAEWKGERVPGLGEWIMYHACIPRDEYAQLASQFNPEKFDAAEWVGLAKNAGMKYIVITAKHHDGFALFSSKHSPFNITDMTPCPFEPLDLLYKECQKQGIGLGFYYSHVIDWYDGWCGEGGWLDENTNDRNRNKSNPMNNWDPSDNTRARYFQGKSYPQVQELLDRYPKLYSLWFDYWYKGKYIKPTESFKFYKLVYDTQPRCLVNSRIGHGLGDYIVAGDNEILTTEQIMRWETPGTMNNTWGYSKYDNDWKSEKELIYWIVNIISRGGNYLLNIGPKPDGSIPEGTIKGFQAIGRWMKINSEAVYGTNAWQIIHEGASELTSKGTLDRQEKGFSTTITSKDIWFTTKGNNLYAIALEWPDNNRLKVKSITPARVKEIQKVTLLGYGALTDWKIDKTGLSFSLPKVDLNTIGCVIKIETDGTWTDRPLKRM